MFMQMSKKEEGRQFILECIRKYRSLPALWDSSNKDYTNKNKKNEQYEILLKKFQEKYPTATKEDVIRKINSLRTHFRNELRKIKSGILGTPNLWFFEEMSFLIDWRRHLRRSTKEDNFSEFFSKIKSYSDFENVDDLYGDDEEEQEEEDLDKATSENEQNMDPLSFLPKKKARKFSEDELEIDMPEGRLSSFQNQSKIIERELYWHHQASLWAKDMSQMLPQQQIFARKAINDIIFEGIMGSLDRDSVQINQTKEIDENIKNLQKFEHSEQLTDAPLQINENTKNLEKSEHSKQLIDAPTSSQKS